MPAVCGEHGHGSAVGDTRTERQRMGAPFPEVAEQAGVVGRDVAAQGGRGGVGIAAVPDAGGRGLELRRPSSTLGSPEWK